jgi:hypothetical protein
MASVLSDVLGKPVSYIQVTDDVLIENLKRVGQPDGFASAYARPLTKDALESYAIEPRTAETTTPTTLREWATSTFLPDFRAFELTAPHLKTGESFNLDVF